jgi:putative peptide zinc metalloprotease protein
LATTTTEVPAAERQFDGEQAGRTPSGIQGIAPAEGVQLLGPVHGTGYRKNVALVRRHDGQMVQLGPLLYALLECAADGAHDGASLAREMSVHLGRTITEQHVTRLIQKLAAQGLLAGTEHEAPPRRNPLLALRWKVLVTNPRVTRWACAPFTFLFRPYLMWPSIAAFGVVFWFVLFEKGVAAATAQAFNHPSLLLLVFGVAVVSAGIHELGHAAACRYDGATPGGMGMGLYLVWPAFYTDVTDAYRLPRRSRLRVDLAGLYFNALVADVTMVVWLFVRTDALLLIVALQILQMVKQLSPLIRADGYHILSDATGVPDLFAHLGPTLRRLLPWRRREPSALTGWARFLVTAWVLIIVPVMASLALAAVMLLPRLVTSAWDSGRHVVQNMPHLLASADVVGVLASLLRLLALLLPVLGSALIAQRIVRGSAKKVGQWTDGRPVRRRGVQVAGALLAGVLIWAWWPSGQYQPVRANEVGTLTSMVQALGRTGGSVPPSSSAPAPLPPGTYLAESMVPVAGASKADPALFVVAGSGGHPATAIVANSSSAPGASATGPGDKPVSTTGTGFPYVITSGNAKTSATATGTKNGGATYDVAYSLVTVSGGQAVTPTNSASATGKCQACTTVAVSFQVVLIVGQSNVIAPVNEATALNSNCPACTTTALADQMVVTLKAAPSDRVEHQLEQILKELNVLPLLGVQGTPAAVAAVVNGVQQQVETVLNNSGLLAAPLSTTTTSTTGTPGRGTGSSGTSAGAGANTGATGAGGSTSATSTTLPASTTTTTTAATTTTTTPPSG